MRQQTERVWAAKENTNIKVDCIEQRQEHTATMQHINVSDTCTLQAGHRTWLFTTYMNCQQVIQITQWAQPQESLYHLLYTGDYLFRRWAWERWEGSVKGTEMESWRKATAGKAVDHVAKVIPMLCFTWLCESSCFKFSFCTESTDFLFKRTHEMTGANYMGGRRYKIVYQTSKDILIVLFKGIWQRQRAET